MKTAVCIVLLHCYTETVRQTTLIFYLLVILFFYNFINIYIIFRIFINISHSPHPSYQKDLSVPVKHWSIAQSLLTSGRYWISIAAGKTE